MSETCARVFWGPDQVPPVETPDNARALPRARPVLYQGAVLLLQFALAVLFGYRRLGTHRVPRCGALLVVSNHQSYLDSVAVGTALYPRLATHLARAGLFRSKGFGAMIATFNAIPIREEEGDLGAIRAVIERLKLGEAVIIYPEGSRSHDGEIQTFRRGATLIAKRSGCTVLPVAVDGAFNAWPRSRKLPRFFTGSLRVLIGRPISAGELLRDGQDAGLARLERDVRSLQNRLRQMNDRPRRTTTASPIMRYRGLNNPFGFAKSILALKRRSSARGSR